MRLFTKKTAAIPICDLATKGQGFLVDGEKFIHYSGLPIEQSAVITLTRVQKIILLSLAFVFSVAVYFDYFHTIFVLVVLVMSFYLFDLIFNLFLAHRSFTKNPEITLAHSLLQEIDTENLPKVTLLCPLYKEWQIVPQFISAMKALNFPTDKLQILLLFEEDDTETRDFVSASHLPPNFEVIVVPPSQPKTKPKAMNYGLQFANGDILGIYDAEDIPDPDQILKVVIGFALSSTNTACVQAKLNFYNPTQNLLTRMFTAEYSLWFDLVLPGLQSVNAPIPLGGTSNFFKTSILKELGGWDAFNVTEDCDLGLRLAMNKYKTAIVHSTTREEANSQILNWHRQRSRWIKGYMQTYIVQMRRILHARKQGTWKNLLYMQFTIGGKVLALFINPFLWALTVVYFVFRTTVAPIVEPFFPTIILQMGVVSLIFGNFFYAYTYLIGLAKRKEFLLMPFVCFIPIYWLMISLSAWQALFELVTKPHYWQKTMHGLHLPQTNGAVEKSQVTSVSPTPQSA